jgi:hypothetical protein
LKYSIGNAIFPNIKNAYNIPSDKGFVINAKLTTMSSPLTNNNEINKLQHVLVCDVMLSDNNEISHKFKDNTNLTLRKGDGFIYAKGCTIEYKSSNTHVKMLTIYIDIECTPLKI